MKYRIAFVLPSLVGGGAERVILQLIANLDVARFAPRLVLLDGAGPLRDMIPAGLGVTDLCLPRLRSALPHLIKNLRRQPPDAIVSTFGYVNLVLLACRYFLPRGARLVLRDANMPSLYLPNARFGGIMRPGYRMLYKRADQVICTSVRMVEDFAENFSVPRDKLAVVRNPVNVVALRESAAGPQRAPGRGPRFIAAGYKIHQKGFDRLLDLFAQLPGDAHLTILGVGVAEEALADAAARLGFRNRLKLCAFDPNPWPHYAGADAFLLPSRWEGMANAALEALACGTPIIATPEAGGIAELAEQALPGAVCIAQSGGPFLEAMCRIRARPTKRPRKNLLPAAYDVKAVVATFEDLLLDIGSPCAA